MKHRAGWLALGIAVLSVSATVWYSLRTGIPVQVVPVEERGIREYIDEQGETRLPETFLVTMPFSGRVADQPLARFRESARVEQGELLARLVEADWELAVRRAQARVDQLDAAIAENADVRVARTAIEQALQMVRATAEAVQAIRSRIDASRAQLEYAQARMDRTRELRRTGASSEDDWERAMTQQTDAAATYRQDRLVYAAMLGIEAAVRFLPDMIQQHIDRSLDKTADVLRKQRDEAQAARDQALLEQQRGVMRSPVDGIVLQQRVRHERLVPAGETLLELGRLEDLQVEADLLSIEVVRVREGQPVVIYGPAVGEGGVRGTVSQIYPAAFTKLSALGVEQQRVRVVIDLEPAASEYLRQQRQIAVGYRVRVRITTAAKERALVIPRSALFRGADGRWRVFAVRDGRAREQEVELGLSNDREAEITAGLEAGARVIDVPDAILEDGTRVTASPGP